MCVMRVRERRAGGGKRLLRNRNKKVYIREEADLGEGA